MGHSSGGIITYNFREGYRSESLAQYIFSAFGPCIPINREDDYGIDLLCNLADRVSQMLLIKSSFGVQVKSKGEKFEFIGKQAVKWLSNLEFPILLAVISKESSSIEIYSTWNINTFLLQLNLSNESCFPDKIQFIPDNEPSLVLSSIENGIGKIPIGKPILSFNVTEIGENDKRVSYWSIISEWIEMDSENYKLRRAGLPVSLGYYKWQTNRPLANNPNWDKRYFWSPVHFQTVKKGIIESAIVSANFLKSTYESNPKEYYFYKDEFNSLRQYILAHCQDEMSFGKELFENELI